MRVKRRNHVHHPRSAGRPPSGGGVARRAAGGALGVLIHQAGAFGGSVDGLRVVNNILVNDRAYSIDNELPRSVVIDFNLVFNQGTEAAHGEFLAYVAGHGNPR